MYCNLNQIIDIALGKQQGGTLETINSLQQYLPPQNYPKSRKHVAFSNTEKTTTVPQSVVKKPAIVSKSLENFLPSPRNRWPIVNLDNQNNTNYNTSSPKTGKHVSFAANPVSNSLQRQLPIRKYPTNAKNLAFQKKTQKKGVLGRGSFGEVTLMSGLPVVEDFSATLTSLVVSGNRVSAKNTELDLNSYLHFQRENEDLLVAKYFIVDVAFREEVDAIKLMLSKLPGQIVEDCTIMQMIDKQINNTVKKTDRTYYFLLEVLGKKFLLFKRMDGSLDKIYDTLSVDGKNIVSYRTALTIYAYEYHTLLSGCFHRDIKPGNILCKETTLQNGNIDYLILIGDFGLFTDGNEEQYGFSGTPNFMCFKNIEDIEDRCINMKINIDIDDISSMYDIGMFVNDVYAYIGTLEFLAGSLNITTLTEYLAERKHNLFLVLDNPNLYKENFYDLFVLYAPHPKNIMKIFLDSISKNTMNKVFNKAQTIYANSFISNIALHELYMYISNTGKTGIVMNNAISLYRPDGSEFNRDIYLNLEGPFAYTYLHVLILNNIPIRNDIKKDMNDFIFNYNPKEFTKNMSIFLPQIAVQPRIRQRMK